MKISVQFIATQDSIKMEFDNEFNVMGFFFDSSAALNFVERERPNVVVLEYDLESQNTQFFVETLLIESPETKIILYGKNLSNEEIIQCVSQGVFGYLDCKELNKFLEKAIKSVAIGDAWISRKLVGLLIEKIRG